MNKAVVIFSGGMDSLAALLWALKTPFDVTALFFDYGQRHIAEYEASNNICSILNVPLVKLSMPCLSEIGGSSLTDNIEVTGHKHGEVNTSFVPGRNILFLTAAAAYCSVNGINYVATGIRESNDFPDCRLNTLKSLSETIRAGIHPDFVMYHPIFNTNRVDTIKMIDDMGGMELLGKTVSCYNGTPACGYCKPCVDRKKAFDEYFKI